VSSCLSVSHEFIGAPVPLAVTKNFLASRAALVPEAQAAKKEFNMPLELDLACEDAALCEDAHPEYWALARPGRTRPVANEWVVEVAQFFVVDTLLSPRKATANRLYGAMDEGATLVVPGYHLAALRSAGVKKRTTAAMAAGLHLFLLKGLLPGVALWCKPWVRRLQARGYPVQGFVSQPKNDLSTATSWTGKSLDSKNYTPTLRSLASVLTGMSLTECVRINITAKGECIRTAASFPKRLLPRVDVRDTRR